MFSSCIYYRHSVSKEYECKAIFQASNIHVSCIQEPHGVMVIYEGSRQFKVLEEFSLLFQILFQVSHGKPLGENSLKTVISGEV